MEERALELRSRSETGLMAESSSGSFGGSSSTSGGGAVLDEVGTWNVKRQPKYALADLIGLMQ